MTRTVRLVAVGAGLAVSIAATAYARYTGPLLWATMGLWAALAWALWRIARQAGPE